MQKNWKVCTTNGDPNHNIVMKMCPATCAMARGDACPKAAPVLSAASKAKIISAVKKANAKKLAKKVAPKKVKAVKKVVKKVVAKKVKAVKKLVKKVAAKKVPAVKKLVKKVLAKKVKAVLKKRHVLTRDPVRKQTGIVSSAHPKGNRGGVNHTAVRVARIGQFGTKSFLDSRAAFKQAQDARAIFRSRQKVLADKRNSESEIYFKSLAVYIKAKAVAVKAKEDLKVAKDAHDVAKTEVKRLEGIKTTQTKTRNTTRDAHDLAKKTHRLSLAELAKLKATRVTADATVDETKKKLLPLMPRPRAPLKRRSLTLTRTRSTPLRTNGM